MNPREKFERRVDDPPPDNEIMEFLNVSQEPQEFGDIRNYLKKINRAYKNMDKNRKGLSLLLNQMIEKKQIIKLPKDKKNQHPKYTTTKKNKEIFEAQLDGFLLRTE